MNDDVIEAYFVLSIKELKVIMKNARINSKSIYNGKIMNQSCYTLKIEVLTDPKYMNEYEYQAQLIMK